MVTVAAEITGAAAGPRRLWYRLASEAVPDPPTAAHALLVSVINAAMALGRDVEIEAPLTPGAAMNLAEYQRAWSAWMPATFRPVAIRPAAWADDEAFRPARRFVLPFSGGLDSAYSARLLARSGELGALTPIHGLEIPVADEMRWRNTFARLRVFADDLGVPMLPAATNWQDFAGTLPGYLGFFLPVVATGLLHGQFGGLAIPSSYPYAALALPLETNPVTDPLLGRSGFPVRHHGAEARRIEKVAAVAGWAPAESSLRPCDAPPLAGGACGHCRKCVQTALAYCALGLSVPPSLGGAPPSTGDIAGFPMSPYARLALRDVVATARRRGGGGDWLQAVERRLEEAEPPSPQEREIEALRLALAHSDRGGSLPARLLRRLAGRIDPSAIAVPPREPDAPRALDVRPAVARSPRGRAMHVDASDLRGAALIGRSGALDVVALRMWTLLAASAPWTHVIDVGASYGEMLIDLDQEPGRTVIAVEPNPIVALHLERSFREAGLNFAIVQRAIAAQPGALALTIDRTWSGMSSLVVHPGDTRGHRLETVRVEATTLRQLLDDGTPDSAKRVLLKLDIEGQELAALDGLGAAPGAFADFAAMVEIRHMNDAALARLLEAYRVELFEPASDRFVAAATDLPILRARLAAGNVHVFDALLRRRP